MQVDEPDDGSLTVVGGSAWGNVQVMVPGASLFLDFGGRRYRAGRSRGPPCADLGGALPALRAGANG